MQTFQFTNNAVPFPPPILEKTKTRKGVSCIFYEINVISVTALFLIQLSCILLT